MHAHKLCLSSLFKPPEVFATQAQWQSDGLSIDLSWPPDDRSQWIWGSTAFHPAPPSSHTLPEWHQSWVWLKLTRRSCFPSQIPAALAPWPNSRWCLCSCTGRTSTASQPWPQPIVLTGTHWPSWRGHYWWIEHQSHGGWSIICSCIHRLFLGVLF